jgi:hypothetical protein
LIDVAIVAAAVVASQFVLGLWRPEWQTMPNGVRGGAVALAILYLLRLQNPSGRVPRFS